MSIFKITGSTSALIRAATTTGSALVVKVAQQRTGLAFAAQVLSSVSITKSAQVTPEFIRRVTYAPLPQGSRDLRSLQLIDDLITLLLGRNQSDVVALADVIALFRGRALLDSTVIADAINVIIIGTVYRLIDDTVLMEDLRLRLGVVLSRASATELQDALALQLQQRQRDINPVLDRLALTIDLVRQDITRLSDLTRTALGRFIPDQTQIGDINQLGIQTRYSDAAPISEALAQFMQTVRRDVVISTDVSARGATLGLKDQSATQDVLLTRSNYRRELSDLVSMRELETEISDGFRIYKQFYRFDEFATSDEFSRMVYASRSLNHEVLTLDGKSLYLELPRADDVQEFDLVSLYARLAKAEQQSLLDFATLQLGQTIAQVLNTAEVKFWILDKVAASELAAVDASARLVDKSTSDQQLLADVTTRDLGKAIADNQLLVDLLQRDVNKLIADDQLLVERASLGVSKPLSHDLFMLDADTRVSGKTLGDAQSVADVLTRDLSMLRQSLLLMQDEFVPSAGYSRAFADSTEQPSDFSTLATTLNRNHAIDLADKFLRTLSVFRVFQDPVAVEETITQISDGFQIQYQYNRQEQQDILDDIVQEFQAQRIFKELVQQLDQSNLLFGAQYNEQLQSVDALALDVALDKQHNVQPDDALQQIVALLRSEQQYVLDEILIAQARLLKLSHDAQIVDKRSLQLGLARQHALKLLSRARFDIGNSLADSTQLASAQNWYLERTNAALDVNVQDKLRLFRNFNFADDIAQDDVLIRVFDARRSFADSVSAFETATDIGDDFAVQSYLNRVDSVAVLDVFVKLFLAKRNFQHALDLLSTLNLQIQLQQSQPVLLTDASALSLVLPRVDQIFGDDRQQLQIGAAFSDAADIADTLAKSVKQLLQEQSAILDSAPRLLISLSAVDGLAALEQLTLVLLGARVIEDSVKLLDARQFIVDKTPSPDSTVFSDSTQFAVNLDRAHDVTLLDLTQLLTRVQRQFNDAVTAAETKTDVSDNFAVYSYLNRVDSIAVLDVLANLFLATRDVQDSLNTISERLLKFGATRQDSTALSDAQALSLDLLRAEALQPLDVNQLLMGTALQDSSSAQDAQSRDLLRASRDDAVLLDFNQLLVAQNLNDAQSLLDQTTLVRMSMRILAEVLLAEDARSFLVLNSATPELASALDSMQLQIDLQRAENMVTLDQTALLNARTLVDALLLQDNRSSLVLKNLTPDFNTELANALDLVQLRSVLVRNEVLTLLDLTQLLSQAQRRIDDAVSAFETQTAISDGFQIEQRVNLQNLIVQLDDAKTSSRYFRSLDDDQTMLDVRVWQLTKPVVDVLNQDDVQQRNMDKQLRDTQSLVDVRAWLLAGNLADAPSALDRIATRTVKSLSEPQSVLDVQTLLLDRAPQDTLTESDRRVWSLTKALGDIITAVDALDEIKLIGRNATLLLDTLASSDSRFFVISKLLADSTNALDLVGVGDGLVFDWYDQEFDYLTISDAATFVGTAGRVLDDAVRLTRSAGGEGDLAALRLAKPVADETPVLDSQQRSMNKLLRDTQSLVDDQQRSMNKLLRDTQSLVDVRAWQLTKPVADTASALDRTQVRSGLLRAETLTLLDLTQLLSGAQRRVDDTVSAFETQTAISDGFQIEQRVNLRDIAVLLDSIRTSSGYFRSLADVQSLLDVRVWRLTKPVVDVLNQDDVQQRNSIKGIVDAQVLVDVRTSRVTKPVADTASALDLAARNTAKSLSEAQSVLDARNLLLGRAPQDSLTGLDTRVWRLTKALGDIITAVDALDVVSLTGGKNRLVSDTITALDQKFLLIGKPSNDSLVVADIRNSFVNLQARRGAATLIPNLIRTNYLPYSDSFPSWNVENSQVIAAATTSTPTGFSTTGSTITNANLVADVFALDNPGPWYQDADLTSVINTDAADLVREDTTTGQHGIWYTVPNLVASGTNRFALAVYLKHSGRNAELRINGQCWGRFDLAAGTVLGTNNCAATINAVGNGWYLCRITGLVQHDLAPSLQELAGLFWNSPNSVWALNNLNLVNVENYRVAIRTILGADDHYAGDGASGVLVFGAQLELGDIIWQELSDLRYIRTRGQIGTVLGYTAMPQDADGVWATDSVLRGLVDSKTPADAQSLTDTLTLIGSYAPAQDRVGVGDGLRFSWYDQENDNITVTDSTQFLKRIFRTFTEPQFTNDGGLITLVNLGRDYATDYFAEDYVSVARAFGTFTVTGVVLTDTVATTDVATLILTYTPTSVVITGDLNNTWYAGAGALSLSSSGTYYLTPSTSITVNAKLWGAGGGNNGGSAGAGGHGAGTMTLVGGVTYAVVVGGAGSNSAGEASGGGGFSGIFSSNSISQSTVMLMAGGGAGGMADPSGGQGGAGGGTAGQAGTGYSGSPTGGGGGTQSAGGASGGNQATAGSALQGGTTGNAGAAGGTPGGGGAGSSGSWGGSGGGGGFWGGGAGQSNVSLAKGHGGGGSGYANSSVVTSAVLTAGSGGTPGNSADGDRGLAGDPGIQGRVWLSL